MSKPKRLFELTEKEEEVITLLAHGYSLTEVQEKLKISRYTQTNHLQNIYDKYGLRDDENRGKLCIVTRAVLIYLKSIGKLAQDWQVEI